MAANRVTPATRARPDWRRRPPLDWTFVRARILAVTAILALACGLSAAPALGDGDPASDVLAAQALFLPEDANVPPAQQTELGALLAAASRMGFQLRVALVASPADLGSVTGLWRQPQSYASFLGQELSLTYRGPLLVVMPNGFGLYGTRGAAAKAALAGLRPPGGANGIGGAALSATERLASAAGHPLPTPAASAPSGRTSGDPEAWIAFAAGVLLVLIAWGASLRARPLRLRGGAARGG